MTLRRLTALSASLLIIAVLTGCSRLATILPGEQSSSQGGPDSNGSSSGGSNSDGPAGAVTGEGSDTRVDCSAFAPALATLFPKGVSSPLLQDTDTCVWGVGSNATATPANLGQSLNDIFSLHFNYGDDAELQYQGDDGELTGGGNNLTGIDGVGSAASYYDGGTGIPQVSAWSGKVACGSHLFISDATTVGLSSTGDRARIVSASDTGDLGKRIAQVCAVAWKG